MSQAKFKAFVLIEPNFDNGVVSGVATAYASPDFAEIFGTGVGFGGFSTPFSYSDSSEQILDRLADAAKSRLVGIVTVEPITAEDVVVVFIGIAGRF